MTDATGAHDAIAGQWNRFREHPYFDRRRIQAGALVFTPLQRWYARLLRRVTPAARACDLGCGSGDVLIDLAGTGAIKAGTGVDLAHVQIANARQLAAHFALSDRLTFACGALEDFRPTGEFDLVIGTQIVDYMRDLDQFFGHARRLCAPGGRLVVTDRNRPALTPSDAVRQSALVRRAAGKPPVVLGPGDPVFHPFSAVQTAAWRAGFAIEHVEYSLHGLSRVLHRCAYGLSVHRYSSSAGRAAAAVAFATLRAEREYEDALLRDCRGGYLFGAIFRRVEA